MNPGNSWNVPRISVPGVLGMATDVDMEWWYYVGYITDTQNVNYSIQTMIIHHKYRPWLKSNDTASNRDSDTHMLDPSLCIVAIGNASSNEYYFASDAGIGATNNPLYSKLLSFYAVEPNDETYFVSWKNLLTEHKVEYQYIGSSVTQNETNNDVNLQYGTAGMPGSLYRVYATGTDNQNVIFRDPSNPELLIDLLLEDKRGVVMEGTNGYVGPYSSHQVIRSAAISYEIAQPILKIVPDLMIDNTQHYSTIKIGNQTREIKDGSLWLDRQLMNIAQQTSSHPFLNQTLYTGNWISVVLNNETSMIFVSFWQPVDSPNVNQTKQWITGSKVGLPPLFSFGNVYYSNNIGNTQNVYAMHNGGKYLRGYSVDKSSPNMVDGKPDFDINILEPSNPSVSPHWTSTKSGNTYATAWEIGYNNTQIYLYAMVQGCENYIGFNKLHMYWEGAAYVYADKDRKNLIGTAFVEQMGFN